MGRLISTVAVVTLMAGCADDTSERFDFDERAAEQTVDERLRDGVDFESGCMGGEAVIPGEGERTELRIRNDCDRSIALHFVLGIYEWAGETDFTNFSETLVLDAENDPSFDSRLRGTHEGRHNTLPLYGFRMRDGTRVLPNIKGSRHSQPLNYGGDISFYTPYHVKIILKPESEIKILGDTVSGFLDYGAVSAIEVLVPLETEVDAEPADNEIPWPLQLAVDASPDVSIPRWHWPRPEPDDPRPRVIHTIELNDTREGDVE